MSDLIERLRGKGYLLRNIHEAQSLNYEAADELSRLAAENAALRDWVRDAPHRVRCMTNARDYVGKHEIKCDCGKAALTKETGK